VPSPAGSRRHRLEKDGEDPPGISTGILSLYHGGRFTGGRNNRVAVDVSGEPYVDLEREAVAIFMRQ
jgi:hypothetical protein